MSKVESPSAADAIDILVEQSRSRSIIPFFGSGLSYATGFPTISGVVRYLALLDFAVQFDIFKYRYPKDPTNLYKEHPSQFIEDYGWPSIGALNADIWSWLESTESNKQKHIEDLLIPGMNKEDIRSFLEVLDSINFRDRINAAVQWSLRRDLTSRDTGAGKSVAKSWQQWFESFRRGDAGGKEQLLYGEWDSLISRMTEGNQDLIDTLFSSFERGRTPALSHRYLAFLVEKLSIPLIFTINFDSFIEKALAEEAHPHRAFDIHRDAALPSAYLVSRQMSILKLHGSAYGLRVGERLNYPAEAQARESMLRYAPPDSLYLVSGFSGSERRMLQLLRTLASEKSQNNTKLRMLWLQRPGRPNAMLEQFLNEMQGIVQLFPIADITTFLQQLIFKLTGGYQASKIPYNALQGRPSIVLATNAKNPATKTINTSGTEEALKSLASESIQVFSTAQSSKDSSFADRPSSWARLELAKFVAERGSEYQVIWIDLEKHHTVCGIISEIMQKAQAYNPDSPQFTLNFEELPKPASAATKAILGHMGSYEPTIEKAVETITEVFKQGKYILVLDAVESYGRPQLQHHGVPSFRLLNTNLNGAAKQKLQAYYDQYTSKMEMFSLLIQQLLQADSSKQRDNKNYYDCLICLSVDKVISRHYSSATTVLTELLNELRDLPGVSHHREALSLQQPANTNGSKDFLSSLPGHLKPLPSKDKSPENILKNSLTRLKLLLNFRRALNNPLQHTSATNDLCYALLSAMSVFRRPRSIACIYSLFERWGLNEDAKKAHQLVATRQFIDRLTTRSISDDLQFGTFQEGGTLWLYHETHLACYKAMTQTLSISDWIIDYKLESNWTANHSLLMEAAIYDGLVGLALHVELSRVYYADTFMPTKDIEAFYEYVYHRCWAIRTITLLQAILAKAPSNWQRNKEMLARLKELCDAESFTTLMSEIYPGFANNTSKKEAKAGTQIQAALLNLQKHCLETLVGALLRQQLFLRSTATPDTLRGWLEQLRDQAIPEMRGEYFSASTKSKTKKWLAIDCINDLDRQINSFILRVDHIHNEEPESRQEKAARKKGTKRNTAEDNAKKASADLCPWWTGLDKSRPVGAARQLDNKKLQTAFKTAQIYEKTMRESVRTEEEDARHRSCAMALWARAEFLGGYYRQAHHKLDLAPAGLTDSAIHQVSRSLIHSFRAELLIYSADEHYREYLCSFNGNIPERLAVAKEFRKALRAEREIRKSVELLKNSQNMSRWRSLAHLGLSQVLLERLLYEGEAIFSLGNAITAREYSDLHGRYENLILDGLRHLRAALELIPYNPQHYDAARKESDDSRKHDLLVETKVWCLWRQFYIASSFSFGLLNHYSELRSSVGYRVSLMGEANAILQNIISTTIGTRPQERWQRWNQSVRFNRLSGLKSFNAVGEPLLPAIENADQIIVDKNRLNSLRELQLEIMSNDHGPDDSSRRKLIGMMWDFRRNKSL